jgi:hypothetical protein
MNKFGNTDSHFVIGMNHVNQNSPCQDHALSGMIGDALFAVVSDGCSSGRHTDIGARVITCAAVTSIKECAAVIPIKDLPESIHQLIFEKSQNIASVIGLENQDLLATCVYAVVTPDGGFVHILGDGHVVLKFKDGTIRFISANWQNNTPYYPADRRKKDFIVEHTKTEMGNNSLCINTITTTADATGEEKILVPIEAAVKGYVIPLTIHEIENLEAVVVASDGFESFKKEGLIVDSVHIAKPLTAFKNWEGEFVKRRLSMGLRTLAKELTFPGDDVAMAAIHITDKTEISWKPEE